MAFLRGLMAIPSRIPAILFAMLLLTVGLGGVVQAATVTTFNSTNVPLRIPLVVNQQGFERGRVESTLNVAGILTPVVKVTVTLHIWHQYPLDLALYLLPPGGAGAPIALSLYNGGSNRSDFTNTTGYGSGPLAPPNGRVTFDDGPPAPGFPQVNVGVQRQYILSGIYRTEALGLQTLIGRTGTQVNGTWTLRVDDDANEDYGQLISWSLTITEPGPHVWTGLGGNNNWSTPANWQANNLPDINEASAIITFPEGAARLNNVNDMGDLRLSQLNIAPGYTLNGTAVNKITMAAGGTITGAIGLAGTGTSTIAMPVDLIGAATITTESGFTLIMNDVIANNGGAAGSLTIGGAGQVTLSGTNTFTGAVNITGGIVQASVANALGTQAGATTVNAGATLVAPVGDPDEPLTLAGSGTAGQGALAATADLTWGGPITLVEGGTSFGAPTGVTLTIPTIAAVGAGSYGFAKVGAGNVVLNSALPASTVLGAYDGGTLTIGVPQPNLGGIALTGGTTIASGANLMTIAGGIACSASPTPSTITGQLEVGTATRGLDVASGSFLTFPNGTLAITGAGGFAKSGGGTLTWSTASGGVPLAMYGGTLTGNGTMGALTVAGGMVDPAGVITTTGSLNLGAGSLLHIDGGDSLNVTGAVTLGGGLMQPFTGSGTIITNDGADAVVGTFRGMPEGNGVTYVSGGNDVALANLGGNTVGFVVTSYTVDESTTTLGVQLIATGGPVTVALDTFGGSAVAGVDFLTPGIQVIGTGGTTVTLTLVNDFLAEGDEIANLIIIPVSGGHLASPATATATVSITDDDDDDAKKCGFGTGLTVFFLFGFGWLLRLGLRRR